MAHLHPHRFDDDQVSQKYLDRAIVEIHSLGDEIGACGLCEHDESRVLGTGHPLADVLLLKWAPTQRELADGVAFSGRSGEAIRRSVERIGVDPLDLYGTNCIKCSTAPTPCMRERCPSWLLREIRIVEPKLLVIMGELSLEALNGLEVQDASQVEAKECEVQRWTHACDAIWCPDIDKSLDRSDAKKRFWRSFRSVGEWYAERPPF